MKLSIVKIAKTIAVAITSWWAFNAISIMLFGSLGTTPKNSDWNYILLLYVFIATIGIVAFIANIKSRLKIWKTFSFVAAVLSVTLSFALLGFYYGGSLSDNNPQIATITAIVLGTLGTILALKKNQIVLAASMTVATIAAYGFAFYAGTNAVAYFSVSKLFGGIVWSMVCLLYIGLTINNFTNVLKSSRVSNAYLTYSNKQ